MSFDTDSIRISKIAGRYLVFSAEAASLLRRRENTNGNLVGCVPQQPTQNVFLGLPIELRAEEVEALVRKGSAYVVDDAAAHLTTLRSPHGRAAYIESLRSSKAAASKAMIENKNQRTAAAEKKLGRSLAASWNTIPVAPSANLADDSLFLESMSEQKQHKTQPSQFDITSLGVTASNSDYLISEEADHTHCVDRITKGPICRYLQSQGYYMTPGLRFGSNYSVYPGDPLRFHAHYMVNQYGWDEPIPMLHLVEGGRLATAVKKSFVLGGEVPLSNGQVRTFSMEWAGI